MFSLEDLEGVMFPHNDTLVICVAIANYEVVRILVDSGSFVNVLFRQAFDQMCLEDTSLGAISTTLFGFMMV